VRLSSLDEQVVVVTGASSGIGRETAVRLARRGARVVVSARSADDLADVVREIEADGGHALAYAAHVAVPEEMVALATKAVEEHGRIDTWVHAAAVAAFANFVDTTPEEFRRIVEVNLLGAVNGAAAALVISSMEARRAMPMHSAYAASKHGIDGFLEALRVELAHDGVPVSVTNVMPGVIDTPLFDQARSKIGVVPTGPPPAYDPAVVAEAICHAAEHPARDLVVGGAAQAQLLGQRLAETRRCARQPRRSHRGRAIGTRALRAHSPNERLDGLRPPPPARRGAWLRGAGRGGGPARPSPRQGRRLSGRHTGTPSAGRSDQGDGSRAG
jgi:NAD(P)-dependent dehydrogenase (short-subunit alcohol dehydrogenase family)